MRKQLINKLKHALILSLSFGFSQEFFFFATILRTLLFVTCSSCILILNSFETETN